MPVPLVADHWPPGRKLETGVSVGVRAAALLLLRVPLSQLP